MNIKKLLPYLQFLALTSIIFTYCGWTADKLMSIIWVKGALKWSLLFGLFYYSIYNFYLTQKNFYLTQKKDEKINEFGEERNKFMTSFTNTQNGILRRVDEIEKIIKTIR